MERGLRAASDGLELIRRREEASDRLTGLLRATEDARAELEAVEGHLVDWLVPQDVSEYPSIFILPVSDSFLEVRVEAPDTMNIRWRGNRRPTRIL